MNRSQIHLIANITTTIIVVGIVTFYLFGISKLPTVRLIAALLAIISSLFFAHKLAPKLTGKFIDMMCDIIGIQ